MSTINQTTTPISPLSHEDWEALEEMFEALEAVSFDQIDQSEMNLESPLMQSYEEEIGVPA